MNKPDLGDSLIGFAEALEQANTFRALRSACVDHFRGLGVVMMSYHHLPPLGATDYDTHITVAADGFPQAWLDRYVRERLYRVDPIPRRALMGARPFLWSDTRAMPGLSKAELAYLDLLAGSGLGDGVAIPVFGPSGRNGYVGIGFRTPSFEASRAEMLLLECSAQLGHRAYCDRLLSKAPEDIHLSLREVEILSWVCRGKSNAVIGQILGISPNTVDTHLRRVFGKLGVSDRVTAALRGSALGLCP